MKKLFVSYSNCEGGGILHFLKKTPLANEFDFQQWNNWQLILGEQNGSAFLDALRAADVLLYQPTGEFLCTDGSTMPSSDKLVAAHVQPECVRISFAYQYNHGFFPILKVAPSFDGWVTGQHVKNASRQAFFTQKEMLRNFDADVFRFDCALRFAECLAEQSRREQSCDIRMVDFILANFQTQRLFLTQNHPSSALFVELARRIYWKLTNAPAPVLLWTDINEANLPGALGVHPAVVRELNLKYGPEGDTAYYRTLLEKMISNPDA